MYSALIFAVLQHKSCQTSGFKYACFTFLEDAILQCDTCPFAVRKASFYVLKAILLPSKRCPFAI